MKIETYLNAMEKAFYASSDTELALSPKHIKFYNKRVRQYRAFRTRILRMDAEKNARIAQIHEAYFDAMNMPPPNPPRK